MNLRYQIAKSCAVVGIGVLCLGLAGCGRQPSATNPIQSTKMQEYDQMMKGGGMRPAASSSQGRGAAPMVAPPAGGAGMMPGAPGTGMMPGAPGSAPTGR